VISRKTASDIWLCHDEIEKAEKLLVDLEELKKQWPREQHLRDVFGRPAGLQLGVPSGQNSHRLFDVDPELAKSCITAHIAQKKAELATANERARIELDGGVD
jgi:hypothetical protein